MASAPPRLQSRFWRPSAASPVFETRPRFSRFGAERVNRRKGGKSGATIGENGPRRTVQRHVLYLGEINDSRCAAWCQTIRAFDESGKQTRQIALFPEDRAAPVLDCNLVHVQLSGTRLRRPRQWGVHLEETGHLPDWVAPQLTRLIANASEGQIGRMRSISTAIACTYELPRFHAIRICMATIDCDDGRTGPDPGTLQRKGPTFPR
jgi:hypothetical protein